MTKWAAIIYVTLKILKRQVFCDLVLVSREFLQYNHFTVPTNF